MILKSYLHFPGIIPPRILYFTFSLYGSVASDLNLQGSPSHTLSIPLQPHFSLLAHDTLASQL